MRVEEQFVRNTSDGFDGYDSHQSESDSRGKALERRSKSKISPTWARNESSLSSRNRSTYPSDIDLTGHVPAVFIL